MKTKYLKSDGFVAVFALGMIILLTALVLGFNRKTMQNLHAADTFRTSEQALNCARTGINIAIAAVKTRMISP